MSLENSLFQGTVVRSPKILLMRFGQGLVKHWHALRHAPFVFIHDVIMAFLTPAVAFWLQKGTWTINADLAIYMSTFSLVAAAFFFWRHSYQSLWSYFSIIDLAPLVFTVSLITLTFLPLFLVLRPVLPFPAAMLFLQGLVLIILICGPRLLYRLCVEEWRLHTLRHTDEDQNKVSVLIVGVSPLTKSFIRENVQPMGSPYHILGVISDVSSHQDRSLHGIPVLGKLEALPAIIHHLRGHGFKPQRIIMGEDAEAQISEVKLAEYGLSLSIIRPPYTFTHTAEKVFLGSRIDLRPLLERVPIERNVRYRQHLVYNKNILIIGAGGTLGQAIAMSAECFAPKSLALFDRDETRLNATKVMLSGIYPDRDIKAWWGDIMDPDRLAQVIQTVKPDLVFYVAGLTHTEWAEEAPESYLSEHVFGAEIVSRVTAHYGVPLSVMVLDSINPKESGSILSFSKQMAHLSWVAENKKLPPGNRQRLTLMMPLAMESPSSLVQQWMTELELGKTSLTTEEPLSLVSAHEAAQFILEATYMMRGDPQNGYELIDLPKASQTHVYKKLCRLFNNKNEPRTYSNEPIKASWQPLEFDQSELLLMIEHLSTKISLPMASTLKACAQGYFARTRKDKVA